LNKGSETGTAPKAYLNYLIFDRNYNVLDGGFVRVTEAAKESGTDVLHEKLSKQLTIKEAGYVYIYLSNDNAALGGSSIEVYFDDLKIEQTKSPVIQSEEYYPFGLSYNSYTRENTTAQNYKYNGKELQDELNLGWLDYGSRMQEATIGRFTTMDPLMEKFTGFSPYNYVLNNPVLLIDPDGMLARYNWSNGQYEDTDENGNKTTVSWDETQSQHGIGKYSGTTTVALFPGYKSDGSGRLKFDAETTGSLLSLAQSAKTNVNFTVLHVGDTKEAADLMEALPQKIVGLIVGSHGDYDNAYFQIGSDVFSSPERINISPNLSRISRTLSIDAQIIFTACNLGATENGGEALLNALSLKFKRTVFGNRSFTPGRADLFQGGPGSPAYYTEKEMSSYEGIPGFPRRQFGRAYENSGQWTRVTYSNGKTSSSIVRQPFFDSFGKFRYKE